MEYKNFDISIDGKLGEEYPVEAQAEAMGEIKGVLVLQPECLKIAESLKNVADLNTDNEQLMEFGTTLHQCLFKDGVGDLLRESLGSVRQEGEKGVRIRLMISPPEIAALPWEVLYDQRNKCFLSTSGKTPLTRYIKLYEPIKALKILPPVKILVMIPEGSGLDVEREKAIITEAFKDLETVKIRILEGKVTRSRISEALVEEEYHIVHFIGHGVFQSGNGYLLINSEDGGNDMILADAFADFFRDYHALKLIVLNSCQGAEVSSTKPLAGMAPQLVLRGVPAVIAMQYPISDAAAILFTKEFYLKLCKGWSRGQVDTAVSHARNRIHMDIGEPMAFATPVLFMRSVTGVIFDLERESKLAQDTDPAPRVSTPRMLAQRFLSLFTSQPVKNINRLKEVKKTYEKNIEAWQELTKDAPQEVVEEASKAITQERREISHVDERIAQWDRTFAASLLASVLVFLLGYVGLFNFPFHLDDWLETRFIPSMDDYVAKKFNPNIRLILADEQDNGALGVPGPEWRQYHARLIDALTAAKARVIVFDLYMDEPGSADEQLAEAVKRATREGTRVVIGKGIDEDGNVSKDITDGLKDAFHEAWGNIDVGGQRGGFVRVYQLAQPSRDAPPANHQPVELPIVPSLGLQAVNQYLAAAAPLKGFFNEDAEHIQLRANGALVKSIPVNKSNDALYDFPYDLAERAKLKDATRSYQDVYGRRDNAAFLRDYQGKIVVVGYKSTEDVYEVLQGETRHGSEIHANVISNILSNVYIRLLPSSYDFLIVALMAGFGALVRARWRHVFNTKLTVPLSGHKKTINIPWLLFAADVIYLLVAFQIYKNELMFIVKSYHLAAPFIAYWLADRMRKRSSYKLS